MPSIVKEIAALNSALMFKHGRTAFDEKRVATVWNRQGRFLGDDSTVLLSDGEERAVGFALRCRQRDMMYGRMAGFDYAVPSRADYFNRVFHRPIANHVGRDSRAIHLGWAPSRRKGPAVSNPTRSRACSWRWIGRRTRAIDAADWVLEGLYRSRLTAGPPVRRAAVGQGLVGRSGRCYGVGAPFSPGTGQIVGQKSGSQ